MFRRTDPQATFNSLSALLSPEKIARLEKKHWAGRFRSKALPVLLANEPTFRPLFCEDNGRPNKPVAATLGLLILKEMFDLTDEAALDNFEFNNAWQYALDLDPDEAHLCQKTLHNFRVKMSAAEAAGTLTYSVLFDEIVRAIIKDKNLRVGARQNRRPQGMPLRRITATVRLHCDPPCGSMVRPEGARYISPGQRPGDS